jgi:rhamnose utilization protein RhaD (predicted bifunctional aldolase and dehydrogenase)
MVFYWFCAHINAGVYIFILLPYLILLGMNSVELLINISRHYGSNQAYVIAGGGNTSYKNKEKLWIKASGVSLADIDAVGFVVMNRELLNVVGSKLYPDDPIRREEEVKEDLKKSVISPEHLRPSVETSLHNLIDYSYIVHTHPTAINALLCANNARQEVEERFGSEALYVEYTDPGYILFKKLQARIEAYQSQFGIAPKIIFLQNHGIFVGANSAHEIKSIYDSVESRIRERKNIALPDFAIQEYGSENAVIVAEHYAKKGLVSASFRSELIDFFTENHTVFERISRPFTPDIIVYCKSNYLFIAKELNKEDLLSQLEQFEKENGYFPKVIIDEKEGIIIVEENEKSIQTVLEVFVDMMKISYLSDQFGGPHFMTESQISFIDNWEVENYRRSVAKSTRTPPVHIK